MIPRMQRDSTSTLAHRIQRRLEALNISARQAGLRAANNPDLVRDIRKGKTVHPRIDTLQKLASVLECSVQHLMGDDESPTPCRTVAGGPDLSRMIRRIKAARWAYEPDDRKAAAAFGLTPERLRSIEAGAATLDNEFLLTFSQTSRTPLEWIFLGKITRAMEAEMAARIALFDPQVLDVPGP